MFNFSDWNGLVDIMEKHYVHRAAISTHFTSQYVEVYIKLSNREKFGHVKQIQFMSLQTKYAE